jgi:Tfp pilus assembly protein PilF
MQINSSRLTRQLNSSHFMRARGAFILVRALLFACALALTAHAQTDTSLDADPGDPGTGTNTIQGRIFLPSGRQLGRRVRVRLSGARGESSVMTDDNGSFTFRRLAGGTYRLTVEAGKEFEPAGETLDILDPPSRSRLERGGQTISVQIQLQPRDSSTAQAGVVNAALAAIPQPARELYEKALKAAQDGNHKKAVEHLRRALEIYPQFALAFNELGVQHMRLKQTAEAARAFQSALALAPDAAVVHLNYGTLLLQGKDYVKAEAELRRAVELNDASAAAHLQRGRALIGLLRYDEAEQELQRALSLGGDGASMAHRYLGALYIERGDPARAVAALETYLRLAPEATDAPQIRDIVKQLRAQLKPEQR